MKRLILPLLMMLFAVTALAQENKKEDLHQKFFDAKIREFVYQLELTDAQKADFVAVYKRYDEELKACHGEHKKPQQPAQNDEDAATRVKEHLQMQQKMTDVRLKYVDEFAKVLEPKQLARLFKVEQDMQQKLMHRQGQHHPGGPAAPGGGHGQHGQWPGKNGQRPDKAPQSTK